MNIFEDPELREALKKFSNWPTYPQLYVNGELIGGWIANLRGREGWAFTGNAVAIAFAREGADVAIGYLPSEQSDADEVAELVTRNLYFFRRTEA